MKTLYSREIRENDIEEIKSFDKENIFPYLFDPFTFGKVIIENESGIVLVGMRRVVNEFKVIVNNKYSSLDIARAIKEGFNVGIHDAQKRCPTEIYVFITNGGEHYIKFLKKHMDFKDVQGVALKLEV